MRLRGSLRARVPVLALLGVCALAGCGSTPSGSSADAGTAAEDSGTATGSATGAPSIDPDAMPEPGTAEVEVDGKTLAFAGTAEDPLECDLAENRVEIDLQLPGVILNAEFAEQGALGGSAGTWQGNAYASSAELDTGGGEGYASLGAVAEVVVDPPFALIRTGFQYRASHSDLDRPEVGEGTIAVTCGDGSAPASSAVSGGIVGGGTADFDGDRAVIAIEGQSWDFGALADDIYCASANGILNAHARAEAPGGGTLGFEALLYQPDSDPTGTGDVDLPYVWLTDDGAGIEYVAGPVPGRDDLDPAGSGIVALTVEGGSYRATGSFNVPGGPLGDLTPGTVEVSCSLE